jgi:hypothetical protein
MWRVVLDRVVAELDSLMTRIGVRFTRAEPRARAGEYVSGLVAGLERKNGWTLAERAGEVCPDGMQRLLRKADWDVDGVRDESAGLAGISRCVLRDGHPLQRRVHHRVENTGRADALVAALSPRSWQRLSVGAGAHGPREYDWARKPIDGTWVGGRGHWLLARRSISDPTEIAYYVCYGPASARLVDLAWTARSRWHVEEAFQQAENEAGLDHYQVRSRRAWYAHITVSMLAPAWLAASKTVAKYCPAHSTGRALRRDTTPPMIESRRIWCLPIQLSPTVVRHGVHSGPESDARLVGPRALHSSPRVRTLSSAQRAVEIERGAD